MSFDGYTEALSPSNPFPATVTGGLLRMDVARVGTSWTHHVDDLVGRWGPVPVSITVAGSIAQSFDVHSGLTANVSRIGSSSAANTNDRWGEFGVRLESMLTDRLAADFDLTGTTGTGTIAVHGGIGLSYKF
jgi:hypothetical protein